jgi:hypothetical protein
LNWRAFSGLGFKAERRFVLWICGSLKERLDGLKRNFDPVLNPKPFSDRFPRLLIAPPSSQFLQMLPERRTICFRLFSRHAWQPSKYFSIVQAFFQNCSLHFRMIKQQEHCIRNKLEQRTVADSKSAPMESNLIALFLDLNNEPTTSPPQPLTFFERGWRELSLNL